MSHEGEEVDGKKDAQRATHEHDKDGRSRERGEHG